jgi:hypothetical protein
MAGRSRVTGGFAASAAAAGMLLAAAGGHAAAGGAGHAAAGGTLGCSGLERLWEQAGGSPAAAVTAASVAMAESGGNQYAESPAGDVGYWQINAPIWGRLATTSPEGNARAAVEISRDGTDWTPWVTYDTGAWQGRC